MRPRSRATWRRSWDVSQDGLTFTFKLRRDAKFDSGNPVTANDAAFSLQRVVKLNKTPGFIVTQFGFSPDNVEKMIRALDDYTLEMKLPNEAEATSFVLYCLSRQRRQRGGHEDGDGEPDQRRSRQRLAEDPHRRRRARTS